MEQINVAQYHHHLTKKLLQIGNETAELDARLLICHCLKLDHTQFIIQQTRMLSHAEQQQLAKYETDALAHMPVSRILKNREFWGLDFAIDENVLDPRADSELIIEMLLHFLPDTNRPLRILDLGTGTGCLLLSLLTEYGNATGMGADISKKALKVAHQNAAHLNLNSRAEFMLSNWFDDITVQKFDVIISNPPYIPSQEIEKLADNVKLYDPISALDGGADGLNPYRTIIETAKPYLGDDGLLIFEMGYDQADGLFDILQAHNFSSEAFDTRKFTPKTEDNAHILRYGLGYDLGQNPRAIISKCKA